MSLLFANRPKTLRSVKIEFVSSLLAIVTALDVCSCSVQIRTGTSYLATHIQPFSTFAFEACRIETFEVFPKIRLNRDLVSIFSQFSISLDL